MRQDSRSHYSAAGGTTLAYAEGFYRAGRGRRNEVLNLKALDGVLGMIPRGGRVNFSLPGLLFMLSFFHLAFQNHVGQRLVCSVGQG
jgi:hypothetical protein